MRRTKLVTLLTGKASTVFVSIMLCTFCVGYLPGGSGELDPEVRKLVQIALSKETYPDAHVLYLLDEVIKEVSSDGSSKTTVHKVFKIASESGKDYADCEIGYNSRTQTVSLLFARTITPDGRIIPLKENAIKTATPYSDYPEYSDYKELTFSMPGVGVGCVIDYKYVKESKPLINAEFGSRFFSSGTILFCFPGSR